MKKFTFITTSLFILIGSLASFAQCPHSGSNYLSIGMTGSNDSPLNQVGTWHQIFGDEFSGTSLASTWSIGRGNLRNFVCAAGKTTNVSVSGGYLNLTADGTDTAGYSYSTGEVYSSAYSGSTTGGNTEFLRDCYIEIRAQIPTGVNMWTSLWLWACHGDYEEMEINEFFSCGLDYLTNIYGETGTTCSVNESNSYWINPRSNNVSIDLSLAQHIYGLEWTSTYVKFYLDNQLMRTFTGSFIPHNPADLFLSCQVGAHCNSYDGNGNCTSFNSTLCDPTPTDLPKTLKIDYVRVYTKNNSALYFNAIPTQICSTNISCATGGVALRAAFYPGATYTFTSTDGAFNITDEGWGASQRCIRYNSGTVNTSHNINVTINFPQFSNYSETKTVSIYVAAGLPAKPASVLWVLSGCNYYAKCTSVSGADYYLWSDDPTFTSTFQTTTTSCSSCIVFSCETASWYVKSHNGCGLSSTYTTGTKSVHVQGCPCRLEDSTTNNFDISIFPNPASDEIYITSPRAFDSEILITIRNIFGEFIKSFQMNQSSYKIDLSDLASGFYFISVKSADGSLLTIKKFSKL